MKYKNVYLRALSLALACILPLCALSGCSAGSDLSKATTADAVAMFDRGSYADAFTVFTLRAEEGDGEALAYMGDYYYNGYKGAIWDKDRAFECYSESAKLGSAHGQAGLGNCYKTGAGVEKDIDKAVECFTASAQAGSAAGQNSLGICYEKGEGVEQDYARALELFRSSAAQDYASACNNLGLCYEFGYGVEKDEAQAIEWYEKAAELGSTAAQKEMAFRCLKGMGAEQNFAKAEEYYLKAANSGDSKAQYELGLMYFSGDYAPDIPQDYSKATLQFMLASASGNALATYLLGVQYSNGIGVPQDREKAEKLLKRAAEAGVEEAQKLLDEGFGDSAPDAVIGSESDALPEPEPIERPQAAGAVG